MPLHFYSSYRISCRVLHSLSSAGRWVSLPPSLAPWKRQSSLSCSAQPLAPAVTDTGHLPLHHASCRGTWAHSGISYLAFGWLFFAAASLAFTGSGSLAGMGEFYRIERTPKKDITDFFVKEHQHDGADRNTCWDAPEWRSGPDVY